MKKDLKQIINKSEKELKELLKSKREDLFKLNLDNKQNKLKNTRVIFNSRKEIARILTLIRERELVVPESGDQTNERPATTEAQNGTESQRESEGQKGVGV
ncbi:MAG: 50S ribosomal protein L29 [Candidatus Levybacteria bacterium]|nr:50S ribosomal protein L29 [Candidatus Levybacteria bacterium]